MVAATPPDLHHFRGSYGGKDAIPLWRDVDGEVPNITDGLINFLANEYGHEVGPEDLFAYAYAILGSPSYVANFSEELVEPGPRLPITQDWDIFSSLTRLGRQLIWLHTFGDRMVPKGERAGRVPQGQARIVRPIPATKAGYPEDFGYDSETSTLRIGAGEIAPVSGDIFDFSISGFEVVKSWLGYRMRGGAGRKSSTLDEIEPEIWDATFNDELLNVLWILEHTLALYPEIELMLDETLKGALFSASDLPEPSDEERGAPDFRDREDRQQRLI